ncbi:Bro-N domain-containing protein [Dyadobacter sp. CY343]|uniref:BRO-N domain-containing protein n=1 Tax=Dyadobacter sp. CY343 TaxID=2907299 RepID=UPI001F27DC4A|nr:Bro-N domain-containing protein [Dyadobacter sp. CY343]MCE7061843.1 Bro-N domain-containing protein [Dyadobacter sp. CY343]
MQSKINVFNQQQIRSHWDEEQEKWFFAIVDIVAVLSESANPQVYWRVLKKRLAAEGNETVTNCNGLKMRAPDGKMRVTDVADTEQMLRLIQSIPSPKAEPFKLWLAKIGSERIDENENPELTIDRAMKTYLQKGYSKEWINQRLKSIEVRKELTDEWENRGVKAGKEFAILTDIITKAWSEKTVREYKEFKNLKKENLRDHMSNLELVLNMLAEATTKEISQEKQPVTFEENRIVANDGGSIAGNTRKEIEAKTGKKIVTKSNSKVLFRSDDPKELS